MNRILFFTLLSILSGAPLLGFNPEASAGACTICSEVSPITHTIRCSEGHEIDGGCLANQVHSTVVSTNQQAEQIMSQGLPCYGLDPKGHQCKNHLPLQDVSQLLRQSIEGEEVLKNLNKMLTSATSSSCMDESSQAEIGHETHESHKIKVRQFRDQVLETFNLCCPNGSCGGGLAQIEGCNAATCEKCGTKFCYLCLKPGADSTAVHAHARAHSGNYWEHRDAHTGLVPGAGQDYQELEVYEVTENNPQLGKRKVKVKKPYTYTDRYHWLVARGKLEDLFQKETDSRIRNEALESLKPILKKNKIWPVPAGKEDDTQMNAWAQEVLKDSSLDSKNKISLLQNELVFQAHRQQQVAKNSHSKISNPPASSFIEALKVVLARVFSQNTQQQQVVKGSSAEAANAKNSGHVEILNDALVGLNAPPLLSLDVGKDYSQVANPNIIPILPENPLYARLRPKFIALGADNIYQIRDPQGTVQSFILSHVTDRSMNQAAAVAFCAAKGGRLPTKNELDALKRAMTQQGRYNPDLIAGMWDTYFWSSSVHPDGADYFYYFNGYSGNVSDFHQSGEIRARCVVGGG
jgi:hypothetical protein